MKKLTALLWLIILGVNIPMVAYTQSIQLKQGDFIQAELQINSAEEVSLSILFADNSSRTLLNQATGKREFMLVAPYSGNAQFVVTPIHSQTPVDYQINILQHIAKDKQIAVPISYDSPTLQQLANNLTAQNQSLLLTQFWQKIQQQGTPLVEPIEGTNQSFVTFLYRGAKHNVWLWGAPEANHSQLERFLATDIWYKTYRLPNTSFISYGVAPDVPTLPLDAVT